MAKKRFDGLSWYKRYLNNKNLNKKNTKSLTGFILIWSAFEFKYFSEQHQLSQERLIHLGASANRRYGSQRYLKYIHHFRERYFNNNQQNEELFDALNLFGRTEDMVRDTIRNTAPEENFIPCLLLIANRFRNNFIHGRKNPIRLHLYDKEFNVLSKFLSDFIYQTDINIR